MPSLVFWSKNIDYFDLHLNDAYKKSNFIQLKKNVYYCDVHLFLSQAKIAVMIKSTHLIHISLYICLCDFTQQ